MYRISLLAALLVLAAAVRTADASAGTYTVRSCFVDNESSAWTERVVGHLGPFGPSTVKCPTVDTGLMAEAWPTANHNWYQNDAFGFSFQAPPGTTISGFEAEVGGWAGSGRVRIEPWFRGFWSPWDGGEWPVQSAKDAWSTMRIDGLALRGLVVGLRCDLPWTCYLPGWEYPIMPDGDPPDAIWQGDFDQLVRARRVTVTIRDDERPAIQPVELPPSEWRADSAFSIRVKATDNVGVTRFRLRVDGREKDDFPRSCYGGSENTATRPCADQSPEIRLELDTGGLTDGQHEIEVLASDPAGNVASQKSVISIDHTAPAAPRVIRLNDGPTWRSDNRFDLTWPVPQGDGSAPVDGVEYEICPQANAPYDSTGCVRGARTGAAISQISDLAVPGPGVWRVRVALRDAAGNVDWDRSALIEHLRFDPDVPQAAFLPFDAAAPTQVRLTARDETSGVVLVEIEARRRGENLWRTFEVTEVNGTFVSDLDDDVLPAGIYDLRARVVDAAGNDRTTTTLIDGKALVVSLPIRPGTELAVGHPERVRVKSSKTKRIRYRRVLVATPTARFGDAVPIEGRLTDVAGNPRPGATMRVLERVNLPGRDWQELTTIRTTATGEFTFLAMPGPARLLRFEYQGTPTSRPQRKQVELRVRAGVTLSPNKRRLRNGDEVVFKGRVRGGPLPASGKLLALQARTTRGWRTFATPRAGAADGRFQARYRFTNTPVTSRYSFRVVVPEDSSFPYARGTSKTATVLVRGNE